MPGERALPWEPAARPPGVATDAIMRVFRVPPEAAGMRADCFLSLQLRNTSRSRAKRIVQRSAYDSEGKPMRASDRLRAEDRIVLWRAPFEERDTAPETLGVVFEDEHLLVIDKPPAIAVHPTARHHHITVIKLLEVERPGEFLSLIHRLDRETSGLLLVARSREADRAFKRLLEERSRREAASAPPIRPRAESRAPVSKVYLAITEGRPSDGVIDLPVEADPDNPLRVKMRVARRGSGLEAKTGVRVIATTQTHALVECQLFTGRQHQIRIHLSATGHPIVGDKLYGKDERLLARAADGVLTDEDLRELELPRHALHAHRYVLPHAVTGETLRLTSPLPPDLEEFWTRSSLPSTDAH